MKRFHYLLRLWLTAAALAAALLESHLPLLAAGLPTQPDLTPDTASPAAAEASLTPTATAPEASESASSSEATPAPAATPAAAQAQPSATETIRLDAARQRLEARLAAIVAQEQAAKANQLQQHLVATALRYAEVGDFAQARLTAEHPALPAALQADTLAKVDAIALLNEGTAAVATIAAATAPTSAAPVETAAQPATTTAATQSTLAPRRWLPPARSPQFRPSRMATGNRCLPQQANLLSLSAPTTPTTIESTATPSRPIKTIGALVTVKPQVTKATAPTAVSIPESIEVRGLNRDARQIQLVPTAQSAIEINLTSLATSIAQSKLPQPASRSQPLRLSGQAVAIAKIVKQAAGTAANPALPSLPVVYVNAKVNGSRPSTSSSSVALNCTGAELTVSYPARSSLSQRLNQLGFTFPLPIPAAITSAFGWRIHPITGDRRFHSGVDFRAPMRTPVLAASAGQVVAAGNRGGYGLAVVIENRDRRNLYAHMSGIAVQPGQAVEAGSVIGWVGSTGNSTGPHLHLETLYLTAQGWQAADPFGGGAIARGS